MSKNIGKVVQIMGPVVDIKFDDLVPSIYNAVEINLNGKTLVCEVLRIIHIIHQAGNGILEKIVLSFSKRSEHGSHQSLL